MLEQTTYTSRKYIGAAIFVGFALVALVSQIALSAALGYNLFCGNGWILTTIVRPVFLAACHSLHLAENSIGSAAMSQIASSASSMLCAFAGLS